ncbi:hypothetical protein LIPSTDRAFT_74526 [Lipomyces starkeyi NRRL Y-11557]|uniref:Uncharacterized protein n=1 Tax=Lipomyces starkeyi NRRL Y-11557 TaxID=675824 RepID=A0A1E3PXV5_LIPST|nr:hypothetical protein LIPSTDRAFT_74526 [Lipomyces starkeyi NRRL Y-11557]
MNVPVLICDFQIHTSNILDINRGTITNLDVDIGALEIVHNTFVVAIMMRCG